MKVLLVNPPFPRRKVIVEKIGELGVSSLLPPLGLAYIASVLEASGIEVDLIDGVLRSSQSGYGYEELKNDITRSNARIVGITATTPQISAAIKTIELVKAVDPDKITVLGGPHITSLPETILQVPQLDYGVWGEGEYTMRDLVERISSGQEVAHLPGLIWRSNGKFEYTPRPYIYHLDDLPFPARHLLPIQDYRPSIASFKKLPATQIITSRGCPHRCIFCHKATTGFRFRAHSPAYVLREIENLITDYGIRDVQIFDDAFTLDQDRVKLICCGILERGIKLGWNCMSRADSINSELLQLMKAAGCYQIGVGIESGSPRILKLLRKGVTKEQVKKAVAMIQSFGIEVRSFFMIGLPTETREEVQMTIDFAKELNPEIVQFLVTTPYPGTEMWGICEENGTIKAEDFSTFTMFRFDQPPFISNAISPPDLVKLYRSAHISYYLRPRYILSQLKKIRSITGAKRYLLALRGLARL